MPHWRPLHRHQPRGPPHVPPWSSVGLLQAGHSQSHPPLSLSRAAGSLSRLAAPSAAPLAPDLRHGPGLQQRQGVLALPLLLLLLLLCLRGSGRPLREERTRVGVAAILRLNIGNVDHMYSIYTLYIENGLRYWDACALCMSIRLPWMEYKDML